MHQGDGPWRDLPRIDKSCFGCGSENHAGLKMEFATNGRQLKSQIELSARFRGWSNLVHGGVLTTILDEIMGWTAIHLTQHFVLTRDLRVQFRKPVRVGTTVLATSWLREGDGRRQVVAVAEIRDAAGQVCAESEGSFSLFTRSQFARLRILPPEELEAMSLLIGTEP
jgi:uncharacterized protein (TIGR00369 family)